MSVTSALVLFAVLWFLILLMILPLGVQSQQEAGEIVPGTPPGAPAGNFLRRKLIWTTLLTCAAFAAVYYVVVFEVITHDDIARFAPFDAR
jgi:predicted secreted protein